MRLFATLGPGDIVDARRRHLAGEAVTGETSILFSEQLSEYCRLAGIKLLGISYHGREDRIEDDTVRFENSSKPLARRGGLFFHLSQLLYAVRLVRAARAFGADLALIDSGTTHYFLLWLFRLAGMSVVVNFHNVMWPQGFQSQRPFARLIRKLDGIFFRHGVAGTLGCSPACAQQADTLAGRTLPYEEWRGQFRREGFAPDRAEPAQPAPFRVLFVGRVEENKGALDIVEIARRLASRSPGLATIDLCGDGAALPELRRRLAEAGLTDTVFPHGRLQRPAIVAAYARAHAIIVPTRGDFCEGMPLVCAEAIIANRPIVASRLTNAVPVLGPAIVEVPPEDIDGYVDAIVTLATDAALYRCVAGACAALAEQFFDRSRSYPAALDRMIARLDAGRPPLSCYDEVFARLT